MSDYERMVVALRSSQGDYQMALDDIGKIGEALGLNPSQYMTHSPKEVAEMVLAQAQMLAAGYAQQEAAREMVTI